MPLPISILIVGWYKVRSNDEIPEEILRLCLYYGKIPSLTFYKAKNSHSPSVYQGRGCFRFCIDMYYFWNCAIFSASFLWWLSAYLPSRWIHNPFGNRRLCAGHLSVSCVCRKECSRCLWTAGSYSFPGVSSKFRCRWILLKAFFQQSVHQKTDVTGQEMCFYAVFPSYKNRSCFEFCFYDPEVFFDLPAASVNYIYLDELFNEKAV